MKEKELDQMQELMTKFIQEKIDSGVEYESLIPFLTDKESFHAFVKSELETHTNKAYKALVNLGEDMLWGVFKRALKAILPTGLMVAASVLGAFVC